MKYKKTILILLIFLISLFTLSINKEKSKISIMDFFTFDNIILNNEKIEKNPFDEKYEKRYRVAILSYLVPDLLHKKGKIIGDYLSKNLGVKIVPIYSANYDSLAELLCAGKAEIVWGSPSLYAKIYKTFKKDFKISY
jgi:ABC-type phosphate/phosphonate transport system substrate-binding protein